MNWTNVKLLALLPLASLLSGCLYGQCIDGPCALERERMIKSIKPYLAYWQKEGMTEEGRLKDWVACGGNERGTFSWKVKQQLPDETDDAARTRQNFAFQRCMIRSGYHYTGDCSSKYMRSRPLCGAP